MIMIFWQSDEQTLDTTNYFVCMFIVMDIDTDMDKILKMDENNINLET